MNARPYQWAVCGAALFLLGFGCFNANGVCQHCNEDYNNLLLWRCRKCQVVNKVVSGETQVTAIHAMPCPTGLATRIVVLCY